MLFPPGMPPVSAAVAPGMTPTEEIWVENKTPEGKVGLGWDEASKVLVNTGSLDSIEMVRRCFHKIYLHIGTITTFENVPH